VGAESYGGHYAPQLALAIVEGNLAGENQAVNFAGFLVGNPYTDPVSNSIYGEFPTYWGKQLVSSPTWDEFLAACYNNDDADACWNSQQDIYDEIGDVDLYALDYPVCPDGSVDQMRRLRGRLLTRSGLIDSTTYQDCGENYMTDYLNEDGVAEAIHANTALGYSWQECSDIVNYSEEDGDDYMESYYLRLLDLQPTIKMLVYSGDDDAVCSTAGTQHWIYGLGLTVTRPWTPWYLNEQVGGYVVHFDGLTFMTIHSAGHMVPATQGKRALYLVKHFLAGTLPYYDELTSTDSSSSSSSVTTSSSRYPRVPVKAAPRRDKPTRRSVRRERLARDAGKRAPRHQLKRHHRKNTVISV